MGVTGSAPLRIGMIGSGFMARFHLQAMIGVRDAVIGGVFSPDRQHREDYRREVDAAGLGPCRGFASVKELAGSDDIDAIWCGGYGFPRYRGGPMFYADQIGRQRVCASLEKFARLCGPEYWTASNWLRSAG